MKAIKISQAGEAEQLIYCECEIPVIDKNQILVKTKAIGINFIDIYFRKGLYKTEYPYIPGKEGSGEVVKIGSEVTDFQIGDRVAFCSATGSYAEFVAVSANQTVKIPDEISYETAAASMLQGLTAYYLSHETIKLTQQHTILIHAGAGGVGLLLIQIAKMLGARILTTVSNHEKAELAKEAGADEVIIYSHESIKEKVKTLTRDQGVHVVYDAVGKDTFEASLECLTIRGMLVSYGQASGPIPPLDLSKLAAKSLYLTRPSLFHYTATQEELQNMSKVLFEYIIHKGLRITVGQKYSLKDAAQAHRDLEQRKTVGKSILLI